MMKRLATLLFFLLLATSAYPKDKLIELPKKSTVLITDCCGCATCPPYSLEVNQGENETIITIAKNQKIP